MPDVKGLEGEFDYLVPPEFDAKIGVGTIVRVRLNGRRMRAWVVEDRVIPPAGKRLLSIDKVTGYGPSQELIDLAGWAARRWAGKRAFHLQTASPLRVVSALSQKIIHPSQDFFPQSAGPLVGVLRQPPAQSSVDLVLKSDAIGPVLLITPSQSSAQAWLKRLRAEGRRVAAYPEQWAQCAAGDVTVVGTRSAVWASMPTISSIIVLDSHDASYKSESSPTWNAVDVAIERAVRLNVPCLLVSSVPPVTQLHNHVLTTVDRSVERRGWAPISIVDMRKTDPRKGIYSPPLVELLRSGRKVVCVLNRKGRAQLLVCARCDNIIRCECCQGAHELNDELLVCRRCKNTQPIICGACGIIKLKRLRMGVSGIREEMEVLAGRPVGEVTGESTSIAETSVLVGTEAVLHRVHRSDAVVFLDFDQELMNPRINAPQDALVMLARASRIVGGHNRDGVVIVQTRQPEHEVITAAVHADPGRFAEIDKTRREEMNWPPFSALAMVSGKSALDFVSRIDASTVEVLGPLGDHWLIKAHDHQTLLNSLSAAGSTTGARIDIDPIRS